PRRALPQRRNPGPGPEGFAGAQPARLLRSLAIDHSMAGYSSTPLPKKLGIKEKFRVALFDLPAEVKAELKSALASCHIAKGGPVDFAMIFVRTAGELKKQFPRLAKLLAPSGMLW